jgi:hypothetical protein
MAHQAKSVSFAPHIMIYHQEPSYDELKYKQDINISHSKFSAIIIISPEKTDGTIG